MTSMRIDGGKSAKVWARRLENLVEAMLADDVILAAIEGDPEDTILVYKDGSTVQVKA
jgi:hypothetical protein